MKIRRISQLQSHFRFPIFEDNYQQHLFNFYNSDLGKIHQASTKTNPLPDHIPTLNNDNNNKKSTKNSAFEVY